MHLERRHVNKKARPNELLVLVVFAQYVTDVLTQETFNAFSKFLDPIHVLLLHTPASIGDIGRTRLEFFDLFFDAKIPRHVGHQILDQWKALHGLDCHRPLQWKLVESRHTHQPRHPIDLG